MIVWKQVNTRLLAIFLMLALIGCASDRTAQLPIPTSIVATETPPPLPTPTLVPTTEAVVSNVVIGQSVLGHPIEAFTIGKGVSHIVVVGGIHGGYELNTIALSYRLLDHFADTPSLLPDTVKLTIIPSANPDGQLLVSGGLGRDGIRPKIDNTLPGRFNHNQVDLNRNWDCDWRTTATFQNKTVSAGNTPFSEPESQALQTYLIAESPTLVVFLHSAASGVFTGQCSGEQHKDTLAFSSAYSQASGYPLYTTFSAYTITGDASDYLNRHGIASFTVELNDQINDDFQQNLGGITAVFDLLSEQN